MIHKTKTTNHPYYKRTEVLQPGLESQKRLFDKYELLSVAKNNIVGEQIYLNFFCSIYSKYQQQQRSKLQRFQERHFSSFFMAFVDIFALRSIMGQYGSCSGKVKGILFDLFREKYREESKQQMKNREKNNLFIENYLNNFIEQKDIYDLLKPTDYPRLYQRNATAFQKKIAQIISQQEKRQLQMLKDASKFNQMLEEEYCYEQLSHKQLKQLILLGFKCISNMQAMRRTFKKFIWQEIQHIYKQHMPIHIDLLSKQSTLQTKNIIYLPSYSREIQPILTPLLNHLQNLHKNHQNKSILAELSKSIVQFCAEFHNNTKTYYPRISIRDIYMDMKKVAPVISYNALLLDAIGLVKNTKSYELKLATQQTPSFDFEETFLETDKNTLIKLNRKYFEPFNHNDLNEDQTASSQKLEMYRQQLALLEQIHVERLIKIVYFILNNSQFSLDYYKEHVSSTQPFYFDLYNQSLKECYERYSEGQITLEKTIPLPFANNISQKMLPKSTLSFQRLTAHFGIQFNDDSLIQSLKSQRFKQQLYERHLVMKELTVLIFGKSTSGKSIFAFRKMPNPVKYLFLSYTENYEEIRYLLQSRNQLVKLSRQIKGPEGYQFQGLVKAQALVSLKKEINMDIYKVNMVKEQAKKKKTKRDAYNKLQEYKTRNDSSGEFVKANLHYLHKIEEINKGFEVLYSLLRLEEDLIMEFQANNSQLNYKLDEIDCVFASKEQTMNKYVQQVLPFRNEEKTKQSKEGLQTVMRQFKQYLDSLITAKIQDLNRIIFQATNQFINAQIYQNFSRPERLHDYYDPLKDNKPRWLEYCNYFNLRFKALTSVLLTFKPANSRKYRNIFRSNLLDEKLSFNKEQLNSKTLGPSDIQLAISRMEMIIEKCQHQLQQRPPYLS